MAQILAFFSLKVLAAITFLFFNKALKNRGNQLSKYVLLFTIDKNRSYSWFLKLKIGNMDFFIRKNCARRILRILFLGKCIFLSPFFMKGLIKMKIDQLCVMKDNKVGT